MDGGLEAIGFEFKLACAHELVGIQWYWRHEFLKEQGVRVLEEVLSQAREIVQGVATKSLLYYDTRRLHNAIRKF